ncbi:MAG: restriction endonuclease subunit S [Streptosporangiaceae bacterium]
MVDLPWPSRRIGDLCVTYSGGTPSTSHPEYYGGDIPWIASADLNQGRIDSVSGRITQLGLKRSAAKLVEPGTPLIALYGATAGVTATTNIRGAINQAILAMLPRGIDGQFLYQWLCANRENIIDRYTQGGQPNLSGAIVRSIEVPLPPRPEQRRIAIALGDSDNQIVALEGMIAKKKAIMQGMMQQLFTGRTRLSGFKGPWREARLGGLLRRAPRYGINAPAVPSSVGTHTYLRITDIDDSGRFAPRPKVGVRHPSAAEYLIGDDDLVFARTGASVGKSYLYDARDGDLVYAGFLINISPDPGALNPKFLALYAQTQSYWDWVARTSVRSGQPGINGREYAQLPITLPDIYEQQAIVESVADADDEVELLRERLRKARAVKAGMMQVLLTGRTRLPVKEAVL